MFTDAIAGSGTEGNESIWMTTNAIFRQESFWVKSFGIRKNFRAVVHSYIIP
jgi:hypothetical protein